LRVERVKRVETVHGSRFTVAGLRGLRRFTVAGGRDGDVELGDRQISPS
jgi:hypothetical protein